MLDRILPISEVRRAHELSKSGHTHGKIVLRISNGNGDGKERVMIRGFKCFANSRRIREFFRIFAPQRKRNHEPFSLVDQLLTPRLARDELVCPSTKGNLINL